LSDRTDATPGSGRPTLGLLADPGVPADIARAVADDLAVVSASHDGGPGWDMRPDERILPPLTEGYDALLAVASRRMDEERWQGIVCFTDSPMRDGREALVADLLRRRRVAVLSVPAFGALPLRRYVGAVAAELTQELTEPPERHQSKEGEQRQTGAATSSGRFHRVHAPNPDVAVRITTSHAPVRLLVGLVRANQPWRLLGGLKGALAAALATSAYVLINPSVWQFADQVSLRKLVLMTAFSIAGMVTWLVTAHRLWERPAEPSNRARVRLFNASTLLTVLIGVGCGYVVLFAANLFAEVFLIDPGFLQANLGHQTRPGDYLAIAWFASSVAVIAGAIGSGFEDEASVRRAAYSRRERRRREDQEERNAHERE